MLKGSPLIRFNKATDSIDKVRHSLSAIAIDGRNLWAGGDESTFVHRLTRDGKGNFGNHRHFDLAPLLDLPGRGNKASEIDIEGLAVDRGALWVVGSHSLKRDRPKAGLPGGNIKRLSKIKADGNRFTLGRLPLAGAGPEREPVIGARLEGDAHGNLLTEALSEDSHLAPFVPRLRNRKLTGIPGKDNGLDVEGVDVRGDRVFLGLRGPVLRGWAIMLELEVSERSNGRLMLNRYRKHFLQLEGLGVREVAIQNKDIYILAGPTMDLDGPVFVFRWRKALDKASESLVRRKDLQKVLAVPYGVGESRGHDHPEGMSFDKQSPDAGVMICYDAPAESRLHQRDGVRLDLFGIAGTDIDRAKNFYNK